MSGVVDTDYGPAWAVPHPQKIYGAMVALMKEIGHIEKGRESTYGGRYKYRGIDDIMAALQPAMIKCGVFVVPEVLTHTMSEYKAKSLMFRAVVSVRYTFYAEDGSHVSSTVMGEGADVADKAYNKAMAGAMKYAITQALSIPTSEPKDSEDSHHDAAAYTGGPGRDHEREAMRSVELEEPTGTIGGANIESRIKAASTKDAVKKILADSVMPLPADAERGRLINVASDRIKELAKQ